MRDDALIALVELWQFSFCDNTTVDGSESDRQFGVIIATSPR
jgi:hypothetical protein